MIDFFYVTGVGCEIDSVWTTKSTKIFYISIRITWTIKLSNLSKLSKRKLQDKILSFLVRSKYLT